MEDRELVIRANDYVKKMANGINPLTGEKVKEDDIVNNVKITRCLYFVSNILEKYLNGESLVSKKGGNKTKFWITRNELISYDFDNNSAVLSSIVSDINKLTKKDNMQKLKYNDVANWLVYKEFLRMDIDKDGKSRKIPTENGQKIGINIELRESSRGKYSVNVYNMDAQKFIVDNIEEIVKYINN